jgi:flagellar hook-length control protein FliK
LPLLPGDAGQVVDALQEQAAQTVPALSVKGKGAGIQSAGAVTVADARALQQAARVDLVASEPALSGALVSSEIGDALLKPAQRSGNKFSVLPGGGGLEGAWGHQALLAGSRANASAVPVGASAPSFESMVADTVSYWVTQGVQNAELKLDGPGGEPVEVRISLKGDQAHIGFRTDQPEIRQMLEGALAHLKEALKSEGLVLSGVSVGASGQNGAGAQEQRSRADIGQSGQASGLTVDPVAAPSQPRLNLAVGRALDIFV